MGYCPTCKGTFEDSRFCPKDGTVLLPGPPATGSGDPSDPMIGQIVADRFRIKRRLGKGGMGTVYEAEHTFIAKRVALKLLRPEITANPEAVTRFQREAMAASTIGHENIVVMDDFGRLPDNQVYLTMEYLDGSPLNAVLRQQQLSPLQVLDIVIQVCQGLAAAHAKGIIHRDMKPENIFLVECGAKAKILDFGIAKVSHSGESTNLTKTGAVFGTPNYMAPEQALGKKVDHRADIYAVGIMLYEMITGRVPFQSESFLAVLTKHVTETPAPPSAVAPERRIDPELEALVMRAIAKKPEDRFEDMPRLVEALVRVRGRLARRTAAEPPIPATVQVSAPLPALSSEVVVSGARQGSAPAPAAQAGGPQANPSLHTLPTAPPQIPQIRPGAATTIPQRPAPPPVAVLSDSTAGSPTATAGELIHSTGQRDRRRMGLMIGAFAGVLVLAGSGALAFFYLTSSSREPGSPSGASRAALPGESGLLPGPGRHEPPSAPAGGTGEPARPPSKPERKASERKKSERKRPEQKKPEQKMPEQKMPEQKMPERREVFFSINLVSEPAGAEVLEGDRPLGKTPMSLTVLEGTRREVIVRLKGYLEQPVPIKGDRNETIKVDLAPDRPARRRAAGRARRPEQPQEPGDTPRKAREPSAERQPSSDHGDHAPEPRRPRTRTKGQSSHEDEVVDPYSQ